MLSLLQSGTPSECSPAATIPTPAADPPPRSFEMWQKPMVFSAIRNDGVSTILIWLGAVHVYLCDLNR